MPNLRPSTSDYVARRLGTKYEVLAGGVPQFFVREPELSAECTGPYRDKALTASSVRELLLAAFGDELDLCGVRISAGSLNGARAITLNLRGARFTDVDLTKCGFIASDLREAWLARAKMHGAVLRHSDLRGAILADAEFNDADFAFSDLRNARLDNAILAKASFIGTDLRGTVLRGAILTDVIFEPLESSVNEIVGIESAVGLGTMTYWTSPAGLVLLRARLARSGLRHAEREVTFSIRHAERWRNWLDGTFWQRVESAFDYVAFELPVGWGLYYGRPLKIVGCIILMAWPLYVIALMRPSRRSGLWISWSPDASVWRSETKTTTPLSSLWQGHAAIARAMRVALIAIYFSVLSAFSMGWHDLNIGSWIGRIQPREFTIKPIGWVRVVSGIQSLVGVYLLALWALTYFGRPFD